jgi:hypothetical protein
MNLYSDIRFILCLQHPYDCVVSGAYPSEKELAVIFFSSVADAYPPVQYLSPRNLLVNYPVSPIRVDATTTGALFR